MQLCVSNFYVMESIRYVTMLYKIRIYGTQVIAIPHDKCNNNNII